MACYCCGGTSCDTDNDCCVLLMVLNLDSLGETGCAADLTGFTFSSEPAPYGSYQRVFFAPRDGGSCVLPELVAIYGSYLYPDMDPPCAIDGSVYFGGYCCDGICSESECPP
jgi:hypothetical protein